MAELKTPGYGDFGNLSKHYDEARQDFPDEVIQFFWSLVKNPHPSVLDLGCGTGISTRQLLRAGVQLLGSDKDPEMIKVANEKGPADITYVVAPANHTLFADMQFDVITAFSAFHWFSDKESVNEIRRILKPGGIFFVVNKNDSGDFKRGYKEVLRSFIQSDLPDAKKKYNPPEILWENDFRDVQEKKVETSEMFTLPQALAYLQSVSIWNLVPENMKAKALRAIQDYCEGRLANGFVERKLEVLAVAGKK